MDIINKNNKKKSFCNRVLTLTQFGPTCWFNAILMSVLYSQSSRKKLLNISKNWDDKIEIYNILKFILKNKYIKTNDIKNDYLYFDNIKPEVILDKLHKYNSSIFEFNPNTNKGGYISCCYINKLYNFLGLKSLMFDTFEINKKININYSIYNNYTLNKLKNNKLTLNFTIFNNIKNKLEINPDILIINCIDKYDNIGTKHYNLNNYYSSEDVKNLISYNDIIKFNNNEYILDSVILTNFNKVGSYHAISGITCKSKRYVYNGWTRYTINDNNINDNIKNELLDLPCELMPFEWDIKKSKEFCLNTKECIPDIIKGKLRQKINLCFSFNKGNRTLIYIKKDKNDILSKSSDNDNISNNIKKCPKDKILNPFTKRCIKINGSLCKKLNLIKSNNSNSDYKLNLDDSEYLDEKKERECHLINKILNPLTKRCIKKDGSVYKKLKKDKVI